MAGIHELEIPNIDPFKKIIYGPTSPISTVQQTFVVMSIPREDANPHSVEIGKNFLTDTTLDLLDSMEQGLYYQVSSDPTFITDDRKRAQQLLSLEEFDGKHALESFGVASTTFAEMPRRLYLAFGQHTVPFSLRGYLRPPESLDDFTERFRSIRTGVIDFVSGKTTHAIRDARAFFKVGATTTPKTPVTEREASQRFAHEMGKMFNSPITKSLTLFEQ